MSLHPVCPYCGSSAVTQRRRYQKGHMVAVRNRRQCQKCLAVFTTQEGESTARRAMRERIRETAAANRANRPDDATFATALHAVGLNNKAET